MFGFNIFEVLVVLVVAIIFLGPDKLPKLIVDVVKFFKMIKKSVDEAKETFDKELQISELKKEALEYKAQFEDSANHLTKEIQLQDVNEMFQEYQQDHSILDQTTKDSQALEQSSQQEDGKQQATLKKETKNKERSIKPKIGKNTTFKES